MVEAHASPQGRTRTLFAFPSGAVVALCVLASVIAVVLGGCGSSSSRSVAPRAHSSPLATVCSSAARAVIGGSVGVADGSIASKASISSQASPQCAYRAGRARVTVIVDTGPQPYFRLERTAVEAQQVFSAQREAPAPVQIPGLGLDADWFPDQQQIMTTDGKRLITAAVSWRHSKQSDRRALAEAAARAYLGPLIHNEAQGY